MQEEQNLEKAVEQAQLRYMNLERLNVLIWLMVQEQKAKEKKAAADNVKTPQSGARTDSGSCQRQ